MVTMYFEKLFSNDQALFLMQLQVCFLVLIIACRLIWVPWYLTRKSIELLEAWELFRLQELMGSKLFSTNINGGLWAMLFVILFRKSFKILIKWEKLMRRTLLLFLKVDNVSTFRDFCPISLCNVSYKAITKILAQRLRSIMEDLVNPCQCSFIPNRPEQW